MAKNVSIRSYNDLYKEKWDKFISEESCNGTFLQSRRFLDYHPKDRFEDSSLMFMNGETIIAVLPANIVTEPQKVLFSHQGSTFGGLVIGKKYKNISYLDLIFKQFTDYIKTNHIRKVVLKQTGLPYQNCESHILDYYLYMNGYSSMLEMGYYIDFAQYDDDVISNYSSSKRRDYRYSLKNNFVFKELLDDSDIALFYEILCDNYSKFNKNPVHSLKELLEFKNVRLPQEVRFYGIYYENKMIAGGMIFLFGKQIFHTQYLPVLNEYKNMFVNELLYTSLIGESKRNGFRCISFGTATLDGGKTLNRPLALVKEGFGMKEYTNAIYVKEFCED